MNKFASFKFSDAEGINALLEKHPLADGSNIFTSEGRVLIRYEDGTEEPAAVKAVAAGEQIAAFKRSRDEIIHSNKVNDTLIADAKSRVEIAQAEVDRLEKAADEASSNKVRKPLQEQIEFAQKRLKEEKSTLFETESMKRKNEHEIGRIDLNIELIEERIRAQRGEE